MLYRIDHLTQAGTRAVTDLVGVRLFRQYAQARIVALDTARSDPDSCAQISRIGKSGHMAIVADVYPDGRIIRHTSNR